jgi:hypothetical protein
MARGLTVNEKAANGPLPGDHALVEQELEGSATIASAGYYPSLNGAELADAQRSGCFPYASFTGTTDGPNTVYAWRSEDEFQGTTFLCHRRPGELFLVGGDTPDADGPIAPGPYVARVDATTGKQLWRTYLDNANVSGAWIATTNLNILANGTIVTSWANQIAVLDADTGAIIRTGSLPSGEAPAEDSSFKHLTVAPDGTLILKNQCRPTGNTQQGSLAIFKGLRDGLRQANSIFVAVDPVTLEVLDTLQMSEPATTPHGITHFEGRIAIYTCADQHAYRYFWDPDTKKLSLDESWVVSYLAEGQTTGDAPGIMGDWITIQTNGVGAKVPSSVVAINQHDASRMTTIRPFGPLKHRQMSLAPPKTCVDVENGMLYSADLGVGKVAGLRLDQESGEMTVAFVVNNTTLTFQPTIGPKENRVLVLSNMKGDIPLLPTPLELMTGRYTEQVTWRDAATGRLLAESDFFEPLSPNCLITPGYGGRSYFPTAKGFITLQVRPASRA